MNINHFGPLSPEVWGSVSDWVNITVTAVTLYFIYRTFKSQMEVQQMQLKVINIENERFRKESVPVFEAEVLEDQPAQPTNPKELLVSIGLGLKNGECKNLTLTVDSNIAESLEWSHLAGNFQYVMAGGANLIDVLVTKNDEDEPYIFPLTLNFLYEDMVGNWYKQSIHFIRRRSGKHQVYTFTPIPIFENSVQKK